MIKYFLTAAAMFSMAPFTAEAQTVRIDRNDNVRVIQDDRVTDPDAPTYMDGTINGDAPTYYDSGMDVTGDPYSPDYEEDMFDYDPFTYDTDFYDDPDYEDIYDDDNVRVIGADVVPITDSARMVVDNDDDSVVVTPGNSVIID